MIVHEKALKQALDLGLKVSKIWRGIKFKEDAWLTPFIMKDANLRMKSKMLLKKIFSS